MKNLLIYLSSDKQFSKEHGVLVKIQIDNSLELGWKPEDILLVTNFEYEYSGIKAMVVPDENYCIHDGRTSKINVIVYLFEHGLIDNDLYWFHDLDAFQLELITENEVELGDKLVAFTDYGWSRAWNTGSFFFKKESQEIFRRIKDTAYENTVHEEDAIAILVEKNLNSIDDKIKRLNITYNFGIRRIDINYRKAIKPLKVAHFHPAKAHVLNSFVHGVNKINMPLVSGILVKTLNKYGYV
jgi:hypothetical protein